MWINGGPDRVDPFLHISQDHKTMRERHPLSHFMRLEHRELAPTATAGAGLAIEAYGARYCGAGFLRSCIHAGAVTRVPYSYGVCAGSVAYWVSDLVGLR
jgi:hypothetical protein